MDKVNRDLSPLDRVPGLDSELVKLQALLESLRVQYNAKKDAMTNSVNNNNAGLRQRHRKHCSSQFL